MDLLTQRNKVLIFSDKYGWETAAAYSTDPVASDSQNDKRIKHARKEAKTTKVEKAKLKNLKQKQFSKEINPLQSTTGSTKAVISLPCTPTLTEGYSVGIVESQAISPRLGNPQYQEILDPDNSEGISQTHLFDDKPKPDCQGDETSSFVDLDFCSVFNDSADFNTGKYSDDLESFCSIKHKNSFCTSDLGDSEFPADSSGDSLPNVKGRLQERLPSWKEIGAGNWVTRI